MSYCEQPECLLPHTLRALGDLQRGAVVIDRWRWCVLGEFNIVPSRSDISLQYIYPHTSLYYIPSTGRQLSMQSALYCSVGPLPAMTTTMSAIKLQSKPSMHSTQAAAGVNILSPSCDLEACLLLRLVYIDMLNEAECRRWEWHTRVRPRRPSWTHAALSIAHA